MSKQSVNKAVLGRKEKKKKKAVNAYLIKNSKRERERGGGEERKKKKGDGGGGGWVGGGGGTLTSSWKDWAEFYGCIKWVSNDQSLQLQSLENLSLSFPSSILSQSILCNYLRCARSLHLKELSD